MPKDYIPVALKRLVFERGKGCCEYCRSQAKFAITPMVIEHIVPLSQDGATIAENLALSCQGCNVPAERLQVTFATPPKSLNSPLQPVCYAALRQIVMI
jgi:5-methylcytosine-specific restriction endonuclease McrA